MGFAVKSTDLSDVAVVAVSGEVDIHTAPEFRSAVLAPAAAAPGRLVVDLTALDFIDSTGLGVLVAARQHAHDHGIHFTLVCPRDRVLKVFRITRLDKVFDIRHSLADALPGTPTNRASEGPAPVTAP